MWALLFPRHIHLLQWGFFHGLQGNVRFVRGALPLPPPLLTLVSAELFILLLYSDFYPFQNTLSQRYYKHSWWAQLWSAVVLLQNKLHKEKKTDPKKIYKINKNDPPFFCVLHLLASSCIIPEAVSFKRSFNFCVVRCLKYILFVLKDHY